ncbi:putative bifunctional diguanylate cyclase/phosphodiesterase [Desulfosediminicola flagellatus]|uniref:putative bifunctional diguanylate cyclase/phosphodiesterase n=1 Tax=Desulfosediminicola flagellatus TaxID=2569541 RepID=UPI0010AC7CCD|nr:GGDEF and EAL domain-containing protein [Desulfosediminicola flagellatus]
MIPPKTVRSLRLRYIVGLSVIALLVTASYFTMQRVISDQRNFSSLVNLAGHQAGLVSRIAYFSKLMATTEDEDEFNVAQAQVGRTIHKMYTAHFQLRNGDTEKGIPKITNEKLLSIYEDPMFGLDLAITRFLEYAQIVYETDKRALNPRSPASIFLSTYGPHVLEPLLDAAVEEYQRISKSAIVRIEHLEKGIWIATIIALIFEVIFIFKPLEGHIRTTLHSLENSISNLSGTRERLLAAQKLASVGDWQFQLDTKELIWSEQIFQICGVSPKTFLVSMETSQQLIHPDDVKIVRSALFRAVRHKQPVSLEYRIVRPNGNERLVYQQVAPITDMSLPVKRLAGTIQDITERKELSTLLEKQSENIPGFIFQFRLNPDSSCSFPYASRGSEELWGIRPETIRQNPQILFDMIHSNDLARVRNKAIASSRKLKSWRDQFRICLPGEETIWVEGHGTPERLANGSTLWYGYIWNITDRKHSENRILELALYDPLTGLANRRLLQDNLKKAILSARRNQHYNSILMLDMDNFKTLNDTQGHNTGDALLVEVGRRLRKCVRDSDTIARLGGDEFVIVLEGSGSLEKDALKQSLAIAEKIRNTLAQPYILGEHKHVHHASASLGVALFHGNELCESELLKRVDVAMYEAKELGRNQVCLFRNERLAQISSHSAISSKLQHALDNNELSLYYQPQMDADGLPCGAEGLLRWLPPGNAPISPGTFIPIAEETGLIIPIGEWVLETACKNITELSRYQLPPDFALAVNISARQFTDKDFLNKVQAIIARNNIDTRRLKLELTESCLVQNMERGSQILSTLREMGLHIELDDFGTGYSSLNSLKRLPLDTLKLDGSLIREIEGDSRDEAILRAAIAMGKALSLTIVAEGVETLQQNDFLINEGCDVLQGYYHARPMHFESFIEFLSKYSMTPDVYSPLPCLNNVYHEGFREILTVGKMDRFAALSI